MDYISIFLILTWALLNRFVYDIILVKLCINNKFGERKKNIRELLNQFLIKLIEYGNTHETLNILKKLNYDSQRVSKKLTPSFYNFNISNKYFKSSLKSNFAYRTKNF